MCDAYLESYKVYGDRECFGTKAPGTHTYVFKPYKECFDVSFLLGHGIKELGLCPSHKEYKDFDLRFVGLYSKNRPEYA